MIRVGKTLFETIGEIPDPIRPESLLPLDESEIWAPVRDDLDPNFSISALELAYIYIHPEAKTRTPDGAMYQKLWAEQKDPDDLHRVLRNNGLNHIHRVISRVIFHPVRHQLFDLGETYDYEVTHHDARFPDRKNERPFFANFPQVWGVVKREYIVDNERGEKLAD